MMHPPQLCTVVAFVAALGLASACTKSESKPAEASSNSSSAPAANANASANASAIPRDKSVLRFRVPELTCEGCAATLRGLLQPHPGVLDVQADVGARSLSVTYDPIRPMFLQRSRELTYVCS